jgi:ethanolamine utilization microcompartment shell protein EutS
MVLPSDQESVALEGVTAAMFHVIATPRYDVIVILGVQAAGVITVPIGVRTLPT